MAQERPLEAYCSVAAGFEDHPAIWAENYEQYLAGYCRHVDSDYLRFDHYVYSSDSQRLFADLKTAASVCRDAYRSLWVVLQVNSHQPDAFLSMEQLFFQAYSAMVFGAECISWACYSAGWWYHQVLDEKGQKTEQYEKLKLVNSQLHQLSDAYMHWRWVDSALLSDADCGTQWGPFSDIRWGDKTPLAVGMFVGRNDENKKAFFICASENSRLSFRISSNCSVVFHTGTGTRALVADPNGRVCVEMSRCTGGLITVEE